MNTASQFCANHHPDLWEAIGRADRDMVSQILGQIDCTVPLDQALRAALDEQQSDMARVIAEYMNEEIMMQAVIAEMQLGRVDVFTALDRHWVLDATLNDTTMFERILGAAAKSGFAEGVNKLMPRAPWDGSTDDAFLAAVEAGHEGVVEAMIPWTSTPSMASAVKRLMATTGSISMYYLLRGRQGTVRARDLYPCIEHKHPSLLRHLLQNLAELEYTICQQVGLHAIIAQDPDIMAVLMEFPRFRHPSVVDRLMNSVDVAIRSAARRDNALEQINKGIELCNVMLPWCSDQHFVDFIKSIWGGAFSSYISGAAPTSSNHTSEIHDGLLRYIDVMLDGRDWKEVSAVLMEVKSTPNLRHRPSVYLAYVEQWLLRGALEEQVDVDKERRNLAGRKM